MTCPEEFELFQLREGGLSEEREGEVAAHVTGCAECQATLAELESLGLALAAPDPLAEGDKQAFIAGVLGKVEAAEGAMPKASKPRFWAFTVPIAAAACCAVVALAVVPTFFLMSSGAETVAMDMEAQSEAPLAAMPPAPPLPPAEEESTGSASRGGRGGVATVGASPSPASTSSAMPAPPGAPADRQAMADAIRNHSGLVGQAMEAAESDDEGGRAELRARRPQASRDLDGLLTGALGGSPSKSGGRISRGGSGAGGSVKMARRSSTASSPRRSRESSPAGGSRRGRGPGAASLAEAPRGGYARAPVAPPAAAIDPNGRFATTYRPGRGHLARFESAMLKGRAPEAALALVSNVGHGAGALVQHPAENALGIHVSTEMGQLPPSGGPVHLAITLRSTPQRPTSRPDVAVHLVMDTSGSMSGAAIEQARQAAAQLVSLLEPGDRFSLVSYNSDASIVVAEGPVGPRLPSIHSQITQIRAGGGTNLEAGLRQGYEQARQSRQARDSAVQLVIVLSDGRANQGMTDPHGLSNMAAAAFQSGFETTTIGVGDDYDPMVMSTLADYGAGGYYYLPDASTIEQVLRAELEVRSQPVARGVELRVRLGDGIELLQAYGSRRLSQLEASRVRATEVAIDHQAAHRDGISRDRQEDREGGMRFFIPGFARDDQHTILLRVRVPAGSVGAGLVLADLELRYKDRILGRNGGEEQRVQRAYAPSQQAAMASQDRNVRRMVLSFRTGEALTQVSSLIASGRQPQALALLHERSTLLSATAAELNDAALRAEAARLDSFRAMIATQGIQNRLMLGTIVQRASSAMMR